MIRKECKPDDAEYEEQSKLQFADIALRIIAEKRDDLEINWNEVETVPLKETFLKYFAVLIEEGNFVEKRKKDIDVR
jgi:hypothetical protein